MTYKALNREVLNGKGGFKIYRDVFMCLRSKGKNPKVKRITVKRRIPLKKSRLLRKSFP